MPTQGRLVPRQPWAIKSTTPSALNLNGIIIRVILRTKMRQMVACFAVFYTIKWRKSFYALLSTSSPPLNNPKTTPSISKSNYSPPSSGNHRSRFVKPAKQGKQRAEGEALSAYHHLTFTYQQHRHPKLTPKQLPPFQGVTTPLSLRRGAGGEALFALHYFTFNYQPRHPHNCFISQLRWYCAIIPMDEFRNINALMVQLGTSCSFDSPGLARNEPTPGKRSQGDSTP